MVDIENIGQGLFRELEDTRKTQLFVLREGDSFPLEIIPCTEAEASHYDSGELVVEVDNVEGVFYIEATQWWAGEGACRLMVNFFPLETALRIFGEMVKAFVKAESDGETHR